MKPLTEEQLVAQHRRQIQRDDLVLLILAAALLGVIAASLALGIGRW